MLKACAYCGRIHPRGFDCGKKPVRFKKDTAETRFRHTQRWKDKSLQIRARDNYMCQYCWMHDHRISTAGVEVHHIVPIREDYDRRLDGDNLISLCRDCHERAEQGQIRRQTLIEYAERQEALINSEPVCL